MSTHSKSQALWEAHNALLTELHKLREAGCKAACKRIETALRSIDASFAIEQKRTHDVKRSEMAYGDAA